jgi:hypothetical protein
MRKFKENLLCYVSLAKSLRTMAIYIVKCHLTPCPSTLRQDLRSIVDTTSGEDIDNVVDSVLVDVRHRLEFLKQLADNVLQVLLVLLRQHAKYFQHFVNKLKKVND